MKKEIQATPNTRLKAQRLRKQWSQVYVATMIGTNDVTVSRWENGTNFPSLYYQQKLCELFGKSAEELGLVPAAEEASQTREKVPERCPTIWNVPIRRNPFFTGREDILERLHTLLHSRPTARTRVQAISGLGGIGKTQTAIEYAYRYRDEYQAVFWVKADTAQTLHADVVALAALLHLPEQGEQNQQRVVTAVKRWLEAHTDWLLILDNVEDLALVGDLVTERGGHVLLTTRSQVTGTYAHRRELAKMEPQEAALFLLRRAKIIRSGDSLEAAYQADQEAVLEVAELFDGLPLALDQAGAYIEETGCSLSDYFDRYRRSRTGLLSRRGGLLTDHPESVSTTFALSFEKVEQASPAGAELLRLCAFLDPDAIPEEMITEGAAELGPILSPLAADPFQLDDVIAELRRTSLLQRDADTKTLSMHRIVQAVLRSRMGEQMQHIWTERALRLVHRAFPAPTFEMWPRCQRYLPHALTSARVLLQQNILVLEAAQLLQRVGNYLVDRGWIQEAEPLLQRALQIREQLLGPEHLDVAECLHSLGWLYAEQSRYGEAELFFQRVLHIRERLLDPEHLDVAESLHRLGDISFEQGRYKEAEPFFQRALLIREHLLGAEHLDVADSLDNLGLVYMRQGRYEEAEPLLQRAVTIWEQAGPQHLRIARALHYLGRLYLKQDRYREAETLLQRCLMTLEQRMHEQPHTLDHLGGLYLKQDRYKESETLFQRDLTIWKLGLGVIRPYMAFHLSDLGQLYARQGKYTEAESYFQRALMIWEVVEFQYPWAADGLRGLAQLYAHQGKNTEAMSLFRRALAILEQWQGRGHPDTLATAQDYAALLEKMQREEERA
jgi:tetratricopeptide (TPR) repeat protein/transcriptional regulator with XRE-family HTH domain